MRKRITDQSIKVQQEEKNWLNLEGLATVEVSSEDEAYPIEGALLDGSHCGWQAGSPGPQTIRLVFDEPQRISHIHLDFIDKKRERTQEFALSYLQDGNPSFREILRQQFTFSPSGTSREVEDYDVKLDGVRALELVINPNLSSDNMHASLSRLRLA